MSERKSIQVSVKEEGGLGIVEAVFSTFNVIDHDGDVVVPGAFENGAEVPMGAWGHDTRALPVGKGTITADDKEARFRAQLFLNTTHGRDTFETLKGLGGLSEWSYIFNPTEHRNGQHEGQDVRFIEKIDVWSVDPVLRGAGMETRTVAVKEHGGLRYAEDAERVLADVRALTERSSELAELRAKDGRKFSERNLERLSEVLEALRDSEKGLAAFVESLTAVKQEDQRIVAMRLRQAQIRLSELQEA